jgi:hypothetical protein
VWILGDRQSGVEVRFTGKGFESLDRVRTLQTVAVPDRVAWLHQVHSNRVLEARPGECGQGDALVTTERGLALGVVTADCVPVLLAGDGEIAAVHAGWRGLAQRIVPAALARLRTPRHRVTAWIGPAIGPCCYEVSPEVAEEVGRASGRDVSRPGPRGRPHIDLHAAAALQMIGVGEIRRVEGCTRCRDGELWSYRREGKGTGHNHSVIWRG